MVQSNSFSLKIMGIRLKSDKLRDQLIYLIRIM